jgi:signal transduction histidine kinase
MRAGSPAGDDRAVRWTAAVAWGCVGAAIAAVVATAWLRWLDPDPPSAAYVVAGTIVGIPALAAGVAISRRRPGNPVGPLMAVLGLYPALDAMLEAWASAGIHGEVAGAGWAAGLYQSDWVLVFVAIALTLLLFPDGRPVSPRWRPVVVLALVAAPVGLMSDILNPDPFESPFEAAPHPMATLSEGAGAVYRSVSWLLLLTTLVGAAASAIVRFRRSRGPERAQMTALACSAALLPFAFVASSIEAAIAGGVGPVTFASFVLVYLAVVAAVTFAMLRRGLYDVDRLVSRTIAWGLLSVLLAGAFAAVALTVALPLGAGSAVATGVAGVAAALAFNPLRRRLQAIVDRRFDRDRTRAVGEVEAFAAALHDGVAQPEGIRDVLRSALGDPSLELLVWLPEAATHADLAGEPRPLPVPDEARAVTTVGRGEAPLGVLIHDPRLLERPRLLGDAVRAAALPVEVARLRCELRRQLSEVERSRMRIVRAGYEERRRLERDLHDGAQQRLVSLGLGLRRVQRRVRDDAEAHEALDGAVAEIADAVRDLREIARGLRPGALDDGLGPALAELARRTPLSVEVEGPPGRLPAEVETAAYYVACEAIANAVKHAEATRVTVRTGREDGVLLLTVQDDGRGGAVPAGGGGLAGLADRVAAHGGALAVHSPAGGGTRVEVMLPCGS